MCPGMSESTSRVPPLNTTTAVPCLASTPSSKVQSESASHADAEAPSGHSRVPFEDARTCASKFCSTAPRSELTHSQPALPGQDNGEVEDVGPPPDGGRDAWLCVFSTMFVLFCIYGLLMSNGQLQEYYLKNQLKGYDRSTVAWLGSIQSLIEFALALFTGRLFDVHGAKLLVVGCTLLSLGSVIGLAFGKTYWQLLLAYIAYGLAGSLAYAPCTAVATHWFLRRRSTAVGIVVAGSGLGGIIYPIMLEQLLGRISYRDTMLIIAGLNFVLMLPACFWMRGRLPPRQPPPWSDFIRPWKEKPYIFLVAGASLYSMNLMSPYFAVLNVANNNRIAKPLAGYSLAIMQAGSLVGRLGSGVLADRIGVWKVYGSLGFLSAFFMFAFWAPQNIGTAATLIGIILYGCASGAWFTVVGSATAAISPMNETGMRFGMLISSLAVPSLVGPVISGAIVTANNNLFTWAAVFCGFTFLVSGFLSNAVVAIGWMRKRGRRAHDTSARPTTCDYLDDTDIQMYPTTKGALALDLEKGMEGLPAVASGEATRVNSPVDEREMKWPTIAEVTLPSTALNSPVDGLQPCDTFQSERPTIV